MQYYLMQPNVGWRRTTNYCFETVLSLALALILKHLIFALQDPHYGH